MRYYSNCFAVACFADVDAWMRVSRAASERRENTANLAWYAPTAR